MEPTLKGLLEGDYKWIFCGGKGGVGKTTSSCSLATMLALTGRQVLLISTDPAHNLSDAFGQKFGQNPLPVNDFESLAPIPNLPNRGTKGMLYCMEIDPQSTMSDMIEEEGTSMLKDLGMNIPGVDEAMGFAEVMKLVKGMSYDTVVFDTAPTGHTLRFLSFPTVMDKALGKIKELVPPSHIGRSVWRDDAADVHDDGLESDTGPDVCQAHRDTDHDPASECRVHRPREVHLCLCLHSRVSQLV